MKRMKQILILIFAAGAFGSCSDWLTVRPQTVVELDVLVQSDDGIRQALNGTYILMKNRVYHPSRHMGGAGIAERLAGSYTTGSLVDDWNNHLYGSEDVDAENATMFIMLYEVLANANALLNAMEKYERQLTPSVYGIVRGEALAIRALIHLDLLRIYGPVPYNPDPALEYLPYIRANSHNAYPYHTFAEYRRMLTEDLDEAERLLALYDPVITQPLSTTEVDGYGWANRRSRMNYYGVLGLQARARLWFGDNENALRYAKLTVGATEPDGTTSKFRLTTAADLDSGAEYSNDRTYYYEHLAGTRIDNYDIYAPGSADPWVPSRMTFNNQKSDFAAMMNGGNYATTDIRFTKFLYSAYITSPRPGRYVYSTGKYMGFHSQSNSPKNFPIIRLAEMYFIIMELGTLAEANELYVEYCNARSVDFVALTDADRQERLLWEFIREYYGEAQNFFRYKRTGVSRMWFTDTECTEEQYRLPVPQRERVSN